jgi:hypothetical protein
MSTSDSVARLIASGKYLKETVSFGLLEWYWMTQPNASRRLAIDEPMLPRPMMPTRLPPSWYNIRINIDTIFTEGTMYAKNRTSGI